ncbi:hypothetical protein ES815_03245 [Leclercia adecarboxylata]|uniref:Uncharacterized protein n=1 Tax=Leclercia adecarboxylata TaxID=83655 RepID=A0AAP9AHK9_9ENTR|nr:hypothetical protein [Leclercia adecarboxylata]QDK17378.1 hypothetical protein ES815_03245 [Leclercia adecarboxylata]
MPTNNPVFMSDTVHANNETSENVRKLNEAMQRLREHQAQEQRHGRHAVREWSLADGLQQFHELRKEEKANGWSHASLYDKVKFEEFDLAPYNVLGIRAHSIQQMYDKLCHDTLAKYLHGLGYVRSQLIAARDVLNIEGKKKYEAYIRNAVETLPARCYGLKPHYLNILTGLMDIPFRRSAEKDRREISDTLCHIVEHISEYRYEGLDERYQEYAYTILRSVDTDELPPMIAGLIIREASELVECACVNMVEPYKNCGLTHEEWWRYIDPEEYAEEYPDNEMPEHASPIASCNVYSSHFGIAQQSLWYGIDEETDNFITSLIGGLLYARQPEARLHKTLARAKSERP